MHYPGVIDDLLIPNVPSTELMPFTWKLRGYWLRTLKTPLETVRDLDVFFLDPEPFWVDRYSLQQVMKWRAQARYISTGIPDLKMIPNRPLPTLTDAIEPKTTFIDYVKTFIRTGKLPPMVATVLKVINVLQIIVFIYSAFAARAEYEEEVNEFLDKLRPLPYIKEAKNDLRVHYLPVNDTRIYPYNPQGRQHMTFHEIKQDVTDADLVNLGNVLVENGAIYKNPPHLILYYEIISTVEFELDISD